MGAARGGGSGARPGLWNRAMGRASRASGAPGGFRHLGGPREGPQGRLLGGSWGAQTSWRRGAILLGGGGALLYLLLLAQAALAGPGDGHVRITPLPAPPPDPTYSAPAPVHRACRAPLAPGGTPFPRGEGLLTFGGRGGPGRAILRAARTSP